jgi:hypothetical protein
VKLADLSKPQWDAALHAARVIKSCNPNVADDRARFLAARDHLKALLPDHINERSIIQQALDWDSLNELGAILAGLPIERKAA